MSPDLGRARRWRRSTVTILCAAALLAACGSDDSSSGSTSSTAASGGGSSTASGPSTTSAGTPQPGGTLRFAIASDPTCVDPQQAGSNASLNIGRQLVDSLTDQEPDGGKIVPWLASSWDVDAAAKTYTFHLRPGVTFSDGSPLDAAAVKANFDAIVALGAKASLGSSYLAGYAGTTVVDPLTAQIAFSAPSAQFLQASSTMSLGLLSPASLAQDPGARCLGQHLVGSGPFTLKSYTVNQDVVVAKRAGYGWGSGVFGHTGEAYLDAIDFKIIPEPSVRVGSLQSGQLDAMADVQPQDEPSFEGNAEQTLLVRGNPGLPFGFHANASGPILSDPAVRQAFIKALDLDEINQTVLTPSFKAATSILASSTPGYHDEHALVAHDQAGAGMLLDQAGWTVGGDGIREKAGRKLSIGVLYAPLFNGSQSVLELAQQQVRKVGIDLQIKQVTPAEFTPALNAGNYDYVFYNLTRVDPDVVRTIFSTKTSNRTRVADDQLDALLDQQAATLDPAARSAILATIQEQVLTKAYFAPVFELAQVHGLSSKVKGLRFEASSRLHFADTWLER